MQHIEIVGPLGVGKTTLLRSLVDNNDNYYKQEEVWKSSVLKILKERKDDPIFSNKFLSSLLKLGIKIPFFGQSTYTTKFLSRGTGLRAEAFFEYSRRYPQGLKTIQDSIERYSNDSVWIKRNLRRMTGSIERYIISDKAFCDTNKTILLDEGFVKRGCELFVPPDPITYFSKKEIEKYLDVIPIPNKLVFMEAGPEICERRLDERGYYPMEYQNLKGREMIERFKRFNKYFQIISEILKKERPQVIEVDAEKPPSEVLEMVERAL